MEHPGQNNAAEKINFAFDLNWIYQWIDKPCKSAEKNVHRSSDNQKPVEGIRDFRQQFLQAESFWTRFWLLFTFLLLFFHIIPLLIAIAEGVAFPSKELKLPFVMDLTEYGFSFGAMVLVLSRKRFSKVQTEVLEDLINEGVLTPDRSGMPDSSVPKKMFPKLNQQRERLQSVILAASFLFSVLLFLTLLRDDLSSWHSYTRSSNILHPALGLKELPTLCGIYVCCIVVWPSCLYLILNGAMDGIYWLYYIYSLTRGDEAIHIDAFHPDHCGGLHAIKYSVLAWSALIIAVGIVVVMDTLNYIQFLGAPITRWDILMKLGAWIVLAVVIFLGPMSCLTLKLYEARREGERNAAQWGIKILKTLRVKIDGAEADSEKRLSSILNDVGDLGRLNQLFLHATTMKLWPLDLKSVLQMLGTVAGPLSILFIPSKLQEFIAFLGVLKK